MDRRVRLLAAALIGYALLEILVDNLLVFADLAGDGVPSLSLLVLSSVGIDVGPDTLGTLARVAPVFGVVGVLFMGAAVWLLVS